MTLFDLMGLLSTLALALPIIFLVLTRLAWYKSFPALMGYSAIMLAHNLTSLGYIHASRQFIHYQGLINNLLDVPLMLCFMTYFSQTAAYRKSLLIILGVYMAFELAVTLMLGLNRQSSTVIMAPGLVITLLLSCVFFLPYL
jgi:hypothetical protein